jgi:hypothetical protein
MRPALVLALLLTALPGVSPAAQTVDEQIRDVATFEKPNQLVVGIQYLLVNGVPVISEGRATGALPGKALRGPGYAP